MQQINRNIFFEDGYLGVTIGALVFPHGLILIDAPLRSEDSRSWRSALINQRGGSNKLLINLDAHPDRTLGTKALDCTIIAHQKTALVFRNRPTIFKGQSIETGAEWETYNESIGMRWAPPDITFEKRITLHWGGPDVVVEHRPGPSAGSSWVLIPDSKVVFVGDMVVLRQPPFIAQADCSSWISNLEELMTTYKDYTIISGRGGIALQEDVHSQHKMITEIGEKLDRLAEMKSSPEDTLTLIPGLLSHYKIQPEFREQYRHRLAHGLYQAYLYRAKLADSLGAVEIEELDS
jgi:glyoxylase-like metal-dependent hydrolase (beta-lactamase superfamily II)